MHRRARCRCALQVRSEGRCSTEMPAPCRCPSPIGADCAGHRARRWHSVDSDQPGEFVVARHLSRPTHLEDPAYLLRPILCRDLVRTPHIQVDVAHARLCFGSNAAIPPRESLLLRGRAAPSRWAQQCGRADLGRSVPVDSEDPHLVAVFDEGRDARMVHILAG